MGDATLRWFNASAPPIQFVGRRIWYVRLWNLFNRHTNTGEHWWGFGLLQINQRHLLYIGDAGVRVLFIGRTP